MKQLKILLLVATLTATLCSCGGGNDTKPQNSPTTSPGMTDTNKTNSNDESMGENIGNAVEDLGNGVGEGVKNVGEGVSKSMKSMTGNN